MSKYDKLSEEKFAELEERIARLEKFEGLKQNNLKVGGSTEVGLSLLLVIVLNYNLVVFGGSVATGKMMYLTT